MATATPTFGSVTTHTITLTSLASDTNLVAGRAGTAIDNVREGAIDAMVGGSVTSGTGPTAARQIEVWCYGSCDGTSYSGGATGSDANLTPQEKTLMKLLIRSSAFVPASAHRSDRVHERSWHSG